MKKNVISCLVCKEPIKYLDQAQEMECSFCHRIFPSNARCIHGHYVCDECHGKQGIEAIKKTCLSSSAKNPIQLAQEIMSNPYIYMHGPEHHVLVGSVLLTACKNWGMEFDLEEALSEMISRGKQVPGGVCGLWGSCGAGISTGIFISILTGSNPLTGKPRSLSNQMTAKSLTSISRVEGARCCKREVFTAIVSACEFVKEHFEIEMELPKKITCTFSSRNEQCIGGSCPYTAAKK